MNEFIEILEFLYYSIIFFIIILFFSIIIDLIAKKIFPQDNIIYIFIEIFIIWICLAMILFYSKKIINQIPNPFTYSKIKNNEINIIMIITLIPLIISISVSNMRNKTQIIYKNIEDYAESIIK